MKIGIFDSGIGGITVLMEVIKHFPFAEYLYLGDTANLPYGTKSNYQVERLSIENALFLKQKEIDIFIIACNTASSLALKQIQAVMDPIPTMGVVIPGTRTIIDLYRKTSPHSPVVIFGTPATMKSRAYSLYLATHMSSMPVYEKSCPLLVPFIEEGLLDHPGLLAILSDYTEPYRTMEPGIALLACTHYPWIQHQFQKMLPKWHIVHSASALGTLLKETWPDQRKVHFAPTSPNIEWIFTDPNSVCNFAREKIREIQEWTYPMTKICN